ncbi:MAG TPA: hypothetical protein PKA88_03205 [Polyangiaceae bacterium]|nr:hypothetical protein [Polyangiaceae bacterium]HMR77492.1 hypothetical protein [Polyangiaceae bacterium]
METFRSVFARGGRPHVRRLLAWGASIGAVACGAAPSAGCAKTPSGHACPSGYAADPPRAQRTLALLERDVEGRALLSRVRGKFSLCFAADGAGVVSQRTLLLDANADAAHSAAKAAHLLHHLAHGETTTSGDPHAADEREARALEARVLARSAASGTR